MPQENPLWEDDSIQFPRLLAEICANVELSGSDMEVLCEAMDIEMPDLMELFHRAQVSWESICDDLP